MNAKNGNHLRRQALLTGMLITLCLFVSCSQSPEDSFQRGVAAQEVGRLDEAIAAYSAAIASRPDFAMAYFNRGLARLKLEDFKGAVEDLSRTLDLDKEKPDALLARGAALSSLKRDEEAVLDFTAALELDELDAETYRQRALSWQRLDEGDAAFADIDMAIRLDPNRPELYMERAEMRRKWGDNSGVSVDEALAKFTQRIVDSPGASALRERGQLFFGIGEYELALADLNAALEKEPADEIALATRAQTRFVLGEDQGALADYNAVINSGGQRAPEALAGRAVLHENRGDFAAAIRDYEAAIKTSPKDDDLLARCSWLLATCGTSNLRDGARALDYARRAGELTEWKDWFCLDAYAAAFAETADFDNAVTWQERALAIAPEDNLGHLQSRLDGYRNRIPYHGDDTDTGLTQTAGQEPRL